MASDDLDDKNSGAPAFGPADYPEIPNLEDLVKMSDLAAEFELSDVMLRQMRFKEPRLPYIRMGGKIWLSRTQFTWFLNRWQREKVDSYYVDRRRRLRAGIPVGRGRPPKK